MAENQVMYCRIKYIDIRYHFIRQAVFENALKLIKIDVKLHQLMLYPDDYFCLVFKTPCNFKDFAA